LPDCKSQAVNYHLVLAAGTSPAQLQVDTVSLQRCSQPAHCLVNLQNSKQQKQGKELRYKFKYPACLMHKKSAAASLPIRSSICSNGQQQTATKRK
jgi:hypothetical protein